MSVRILIAALLCLACAVPAWGQTGRTAYDFLTIPSSSHAYGLGGVNIAVIDDDVNLAEQNPALLGPEIGRQVSFGYMHWLGSANFAGARYGMAAGEHGAWGAGIRYLNYGTMTGYDHTGMETGTFTPSDIVVEGSYAHDFNDRLRGGINLKGGYSNYEQYTAFALAVDLGVNYYNPERDLSLSLVLKNMGGQLKRFEEHYDRLPFDVQLGWMKGFGDTGFSFGITAWHLTKWELPVYEHTDAGLQELKIKNSFGRNLFRHLVFGAQYAPSERFYIDLGYNYKTRTDMSAYQRNFLSGFSAGLGFKARAFTAGIAAAMPHKGGATVLLNLSLGIGALMGEE